MELRREELDRLRRLMARLYASRSAKTAFARGARRHLKKRQIQLTPPARKLLARSDILPLYIEELFWSLQNSAVLSPEAAARLPERAELEGAFRAVFAGLEAAFGEGFTVEERQALSRLGAALTAGTSPNSTALL